MEKTNIPTVDLSPFFNEGDEDSRKKAKEIINHACSEYGFFEVVNHGIPLSLMTQALELSKTFFEYPDEEKQKCSPRSEVPTGYSRQPAHSADRNEYLLMFPPGSSFNVYPGNPPELREVVEELFIQFTKTGLLIESILNECLNLPSNFLKDYNKDRSCDLMVALRYFPAAPAPGSKIGLSEHQDGNCFTFVIQDDVGGLEVLSNGMWVPVTATKGSLIVNIGDIIQVLSNDKYKSATHRVVSKEGRHRHSYAFFYTMEGDKWVEPLPMFTKEIGEPAKYGGFFYKDYQQLRMRNKTHPPSKPEDVIHITHYAIPKLG